MTVQALPYIIALGLFWGSTLIASRFSIGQFHPTTYIGLRLSLAGLSHAAVYALSRQRPWPQDKQVWRHAILLGVLGTAVPMTFIVSYTSLAVSPPSCLPPIPPSPSSSPISSYKMNS